MLTLTDKTGGCAVYLIGFQLLQLLDTMLSAREANFESLFEHRSVFCGKNNNYIRILTMGQYVLSLASNIHV